MLYFRKANVAIYGMERARVIVALPVAFFVKSSMVPVRESTKEMDFVVSGSSDCLRLLNSSVPTIYVPFTILANENWQLTINCTKMPARAPHAIF